MIFKIYDVHVTETNGHSPLPGQTYTN